MREGGREGEREGGGRKGRRDKNFLYTVSLLIDCTLRGRFEM